MTEQLTNVTYQQLEVGSYVSYQRTISEQDLLLFAAVSGDVNPLHLNKDYAARTPFKTPIAHGMLLGAYISAGLATELPGPGSLYLGQTLDFIKPVRPGDTVTITLLVAEKLEKGVAIIDCKGINQDGDEVVSGQAKVRPSKRSVSTEKPTLPQVEICH